MSRLNVEIIKRAQPSGIDLVGLFHAPDPSLTGFDQVTLTGFDQVTLTTSSPASINSSTST
jgi:hypothetical protein